MSRDTRYSTALWDVRLTDEEIAQLAAGVSPTLIRPDHLLSYEPEVARPSEEER